MKSSLVLSRFQTFYGPTQDEVVYDSDGAPADRTFILRRVNTASNTVDSALFLTPREAQRLAKFIHDHVGRGTSLSGHQARPRSRSARQRVTHRAAAVRKRQQPA